MYDALLTLHITSAALVLGTLFLQSLLVVMALRLKGPVQAEAVRGVQRRVQAFVYYPLLALALGTGLWIAVWADAFAGGRWLHWKLVAVVLLIGLGLLTGQSLRSGRAAKGPALAVHVAVFFLALLIVHLASAKPF